MVTEAQPRAVEIIDSDTGAPHQDAADGEKPQQKRAAKPESSRLKAPPKVPTSKSAVAGLPDEVLTSVAQAKFEAQEDRLRDIVRPAMALLRDFPKLNAGECSKRATEIRRSLLKYEAQHLRVWELQECTRKRELEVLAREAERSITEAAEEEERINGLRIELEESKKRRRLLEEHEKAAEEINQKKTRSELQAEIDRTKCDIQRLKDQRRDLEARTEQRNQRAQLLRHMVADVKLELQRESAMAVEVVADSPEPQRERAQSEAEPNPEVLS